MWVVQLVYYLIDETHEGSSAQCGSVKAFCSVSHNRYPAANPIDTLIRNNCTARSTQSDASPRDVAKEKL